MIIELFYVMNKGILCSVLINVIDRADYLCDINLSENTQIN